MLPATPGKPFLKVLRVKYIPKEPSEFIKPVNHAKWLNQEYI